MSAASISGASRGRMVVLVRMVWSKRLCIGRGRAATTVWFQLTASRVACRSRRPANLSVALCLHFFLYVCADTLAARVTGKQEDSSRRCHDWMHHAETFALMHDQVSVHTHARARTHTHIHTYTHTHIHTYTCSLRVCIYRHESPGPWQLMLCINLMHQHRSEALTFSEPFVSVSAAPGSAHPPYVSVLILPLLILLR